MQTREIRYILLYSKVGMFLVRANKPRGLSKPIRRRPWISLKGWFAYCSAISSTAVSSTLGLSKRIGSRRTRTTPVTLHSPLLDEARLRASMCETVCMQDVILLCQPRKWSGRRRHCTSLPPLILMNLSASADCIIERF